MELPDGRSRSRSLSRDDCNSHASGPIEIAALRGGLCAGCSETIAISTIPGAVLLDQTLLRSASGSLVADQQPKTTAAPMRKTVTSIHGDPLGHRAINPRNSRPVVGGSAVRPGDSAALHSSKAASEGRNLLSQPAAESTLATTTSVFVIPSRCHSANLVFGQGCLAWFSPNRATRQRRLDRLRTWSSPVTSRWTRPHMPQTGRAPLPTSARLSSEGMGEGDRLAGRLGVGDLPPR